MTQADVDRGILNILVGVLRLRPAEFVIFRIQQRAGQKVVACHVRGNINLEECQVPCAPLTCIEAIERIEPSGRMGVHGPTTGGVHNAVCSVLLPEDVVAIASGKAHPVIGSRPGNARPT